MLGLIGQRKRFARPQNLMPILAVLAVYALSACSKQKQPDLATSSPSITSSVIINGQPPTTQLAQIYSQPITQRLAAMNSQLNNSKASALTASDVQMLQGAGILDSEDLVALQPFIKHPKN